MRSNSTRSSSRARLAPRQKWVPKPPNATWSFGVRSTSKRSGSGKRALVAVAGRVEQQHALALAQLLAVQLDVARERAVHVLDRRHPAQHLLDGGRDQRGVLEQLPLLVRVLEQRAQAARHHVAGRLVAADQDQQALLEDLLLAESIAVELGVDEDAHQVVGRGARAAVGDHRLRIAQILVDDRGRARAPLLRVFDRGRLAAAEHLVGPAQQHPAVLRRHAEHVADHDHRHPARDVGHEVALAARGYRVDQLVAERAQLRLVIRDAPHREAAVHEVAAALVQRVVEVDHRRDPRAGLGPRALPRAEQLRVLRGVHDVGVAGEAPDPAQLVYVGLEVGGRAVAHPPEALVGVEVEEPVEQVDVVARGMAGHGSPSILSTISSPRAREIGQRGARRRVRDRRVRGCACARRGRLVLDRRRARHAEHDRLQAPAGERVPDRRERALPRRDALDRRASSVARRRRGVRGGGRRRLAAPVDRDGPDARQAQVQGDREPLVRDRARGDAQDAQSRAADGAPGLSRSSRRRASRSAWRRATTTTTRCGATRATRPWRTSARST